MFCERMAVHEREIPLLTIPDAAAVTNCLSSVWGLGHQLLLHAGIGKRIYEHTAGKGYTASVLPSPPRLHWVQWQMDMHKPIARKLVTQSHDVFVALQKHGPESTGAVRKPQLVKYSRRYRAFMGECVQDLRKAAEDPNLSREDCESYAAQSELLQTMGLIWSLCEILFVETLPGGVVLQQLQDWLKLHFTEGDRLAREVLESEDLLINDKYWRAVYIYVMQGRLAEARHLLSLHVQQQQDTLHVFARMDKLMRDMPVFGASSRQSLAEFDLRWRHWQDQCRQCLEDNTFISYSHLHAICKILSGDLSVLSEQGDVIASWYQMLVTKLLYCNPTVRALDLQHHAKACIDELGGSSRMNAVDNILMAAFEFDVHQVIKASSATMSNWWFVAHLADLLHHCGKLDSHQLNFGSNLREFLLLEYASTLMSHNSLWQVVAGYLDHCPEFGRHYLELFIERVPLQSERKATKVLRVCEEREMTEQVRSICKVLGMRALQQGQLGSALSWCIRSKDAAFATFLSDRFLAEYSLGGGFSNLDLIDNLGAAMLLSDRLTFLGKYREFHKLYERGEFQEAASLLLSLLTAKLAPKSFWLILLTDVLPLLELEELIFSSQQTYELLHCLHELTQWFASEDYLRSEAATRKTKGQQELETEKLELLKLALARNLARAIQEEVIIS
ncbi:nuclear pore complex protein Nup85-like [Acanthaster planci]|uniref:Nuclear pore complex protein Nup85 n=1 Tax=Acanthaster planci TaxID=133434 RepID=A0A8B7ZEB8_ACAPL|nr:nuclear pore complex protein Nup85-like [Acanthaster planci]